MRLAACLLFVSAVLVQGPQPDVTNARFEARAFSGSLESQLNATNAAWFGYAVAGARPIENNCCGRCNLEEWCHTSNSEEPKRRVALEGTGTIALLYRVEHGAIEKIRVESIECPLDAGGLPFIWLTGVPAAASLSLLDRLATTSASDGLRDAAIFAISQHDGPEAIASLEHLASPPELPHVRGQAMFWLAQRAGEKAASFISNAIQNDPNTEVKTKAVFALSQLPRDEGVPRLIEVARSNNNREVRKQAFFWLGQSQDPRALAFIEQILER